MKWEAVAIRLESVVDGSVIITAVMSVVSLWLLTVSASATISGGPTVVGFSEIRISGLMIASPRLTLEAKSASNKKCGRQAKET